MTVPSIPTRRSWTRRLADVLRAWRRQRASLQSLRGLDRHTLRDIGIDASEVPSIEAEARELAPRTRRRIVVALDASC